ncbi:unnamed protein product [Albugo candida]|uniref:Zinc finger CHCC-type domain-containing protein n=1 Tax=Albugo candida TaxID=65357 RepID=A0A024FTE4_9STRA|nr:unnamed protein product [Albugo candida]|eukprot:CCI10373.1 unnamed protein product [Albugo candida]
MHRFYNSVKHIILIGRVLSISMYRSLPTRCRQLAKHSVALHVPSYNALRATISSGCERSFATIYDAKPRKEDTVRHRSDAEVRIAKLPIVEVEGSFAVCDGGGGALGHPLEYIQLDTVERYEPQTCKYCGIRYKMKEGYHPRH